MADILIPTAVYVGLLDSYTVPWEFLGHHRHQDARDVDAQADFNAFHIGTAFMKGR
jgi:hypothetical protein